MKTRRALIALAACAAFVGYLENPAHSAQAKWSEVKGWTIIGDTDVRACWARTLFEDGIVLSIGFGRSATLSITGVNAKAGDTYRVAVVASTGASGILEAVSPLDGGVVFRGLNKNTVRTLASASSIYIEGLGRYNLYGSKAAMLEAWTCFEALSGF